MEIFLTSLVDERGCQYQFHLSLLTWHASRIREFRPSNININIKKEEKYS